MTIAAEVRAMAEQIASINEAVNALSSAMEKLVAEKQDPAKVVSEVLDKKLSEVNPMMENPSPRYSLLEPDVAEKKRTLL